MYTFDGRVRYSEIDHRGTMTITSLINYFQDCSTFHSEDVGLGADVLRKKGRAWILSYWQVEIGRYPKLGEKITTGTFATGFDRFFGHRDFVMLDEKKEQIARAYSLWIFMDTEKGRPARLQPGDADAYGEEPAFDMELQSRKIALPETFAARPPFPVQRCHIDTNEHVNNSQYVQMALEVLPRETQIGKLRVEYMKSAVYGDMICPKIALEDGRTYVLLCDEADKPYAAIEIRERGL